MSDIRTQVGIVGAGPAGLLLSHLLHIRGIETFVLEVRSREYVEGRIRAGVLEQGTVDVLNESGVGDRMRREGLAHRGLTIRFGGQNRRIDFVEHSGKAVTVYGQHEVVKDLIAGRIEAGGSLLFEVKDVAVEDIESAFPSIRFRDSDGAAHTIHCDFVAGCDGFHGVCRQSIPAGAITVYEHEYPLAWLGILAKSPPVSDELIYVHHERGFALFSMRSPQVTRLYLQCPPEEELSAWPDERIWDELRLRLTGKDGSPTLEEGPILQRSITAMRSFVVEPMRYGQLLLAGDAAHIVPPTGAKGMNLAVSDVNILAEGLAAYIASGDSTELDSYSDTCLRRAWRAQRFSNWMTRTLHRFPHHGPFDHQLQLAELDYLMSSRAAAQSFAENYVGLSPYDAGHAT